MKKYYAVIDTNVIVSAALRWKSVPGSILELAFSGVIIPVLNNEIVAKYKEVLSRPKFKFTKDILHDRRKVTVDTSLRLARFFGVSDRYFLDIQNDIDIRNLRISMADDIKMIHPYNTAVM